MNSENNYRVIPHAAQSASPRSHVLTQLWTPLVQCSQPATALSPLRMAQRSHSPQTSTQSLEKFFKWAWQLSSLSLPHCWLGGVGCRTLLICCCCWKPGKWLNWGWQETHMMSVTRPAKLEKCMTMGAC